MTHTHEEMKEAAVALLATCRQVMTGRQIHVCERIQSGEYAEDEEMLELIEDAKRCRHCDGLEHPDLHEVDIEIRNEETAIFRNLEIQFSREIAEHIDASKRAFSLRVVETHDRLNPEFKLVA